MGLIDLGFQGDPFIWTNHQKDENIIMERLDRAMANQRWRTTYPHAAVTHLPCIASVHAPILLRTKHLNWKNERNYKFEHLWLSHPNIHHIVNGSSERESDDELVVRQCSQPEPVSTLGPDTSQHYMTDLTWETKDDIKEWLIPKAKREDVCGCSK
ncbi:uncharacterized protein LOC113352388 [Papaver somniferum]|uniref:uncharacterized protein LOC113352388 n=1 Tax=Papaver somniferum TaxID=3469 RepID=UPI000E6F5E44|nr:uncharacterized protein LOC113352388 [Papaver somniferum]